MKTTKQMVLFMGLPASGKSSYFQKYFADSHVRVNLDMLRTRHRERLLIEACITAQQDLVIDNTNVTRKLREKYYSLARKAGFTLHLYCFLTSTNEALRRNAIRTRSVPKKAIYGMASQLEYPSQNEPADKIYFVRIDQKSNFTTQDYNHELY